MRILPSGSPSAVRNAAYARHASREFGAALIAARSVSSGERIDAGSGALAFEALVTAVVVVGLSAFDFGAFAAFAGLADDTFGAFAAFAGLADEAFVAFAFAAFAFAGLADESFAAF